MNDALHERVLRQGITVPCKWCSTATRMTGTRMCDPCWELERRISADPELARRMLAELDTP